MILEDDNEEDKYKDQLDAVPPDPDGQWHRHCREDCVFKKKIKDGWRRSATGNFSAKVAGDKMRLDTKRRLGSKMKTRETRKTF